MVVLLAVPRAVGLLTSLRRWLPLFHHGAPMATWADRRGPGLGAGLLGPSPSRCWRRATTPARTFARPAHCHRGAGVHAACSMPLVPWMAHAGLALSIGLGRWSMRCGCWWSLLRRGRMCPAGGRLGAAGAGGELPDGGAAGCGPQTTLPGWLRAHSLQRACWPAARWGGGAVLLLPCWPVGGPAQPVCGAELGQGHADELRSHAAGIFCSLVHSDDGDAIAAAGGEAASIAQDTNTPSTSAGANEVDHLVARLQ